MKKIGFVDYYISEWHANNYPKWIEEACKKLGVEYKIAYAWAELDVSPVDGVNTDEWCKKFGVERCKTLSELCEKSDFIVILAPSNPEKHLLYAETVLKYGKRTYIDKTFAPDVATCEKIFALGDEYGTPFFSSSALGYADELDVLSNVTTVITTGGGSNLPEYIIHQAEMVVKKLGVGVSDVTAEWKGTQCFIDVKYQNGKRATMVYGKNMPFSIYMSNGEKEVWKRADSPFFNNLIEDIVRFFGDGIKSFDGSRTREVIKLCEMAVAAAKNQ